LEDQFFAKLREIQRKERANSSLARVGNDFYKRTHRYLDNIRDIAVNDPFSEESDLLRNAQRIATEICEIREHKIANAAVMNIHRSYHLFQGKPQFDLIDTTPLNITEEEEKLYFSFIDVLKSHRRSISLDELTTDDNTSKDFNQLSDKKPSDDSINNKSDDINSNINSSTNSNTNSNIESNSIESNNRSNDKFINNKLKNKNNDIKNNLIENNNVKNDNVLKRLKTIKSAKVIEDEKIESIEKQISNSNSFNEKNENYESSKSVKSAEKDKSKASKDFNQNNFIKGNKNIKKGKKSELANIMGNEDDQFVDLDSLVVDETVSSDNSFNLNKSKSTVNKIANVMILIFSEINSIMGVDKKIYGPFKPQDIVIMPDINAKILIKNKKGRLVKI
jgi:DNA replication factor GINS